MLLASDTTGSAGESRFLCAEQVLSEQQTLRLERGQMNKPDRLPNSVTVRHANPGRFLWLLGLLVVALAFTQIPAFAQFASGSIGATVSDATGAVVPQAKVILKNEAT